MRRATRSSSLIVLAALAGPHTSLAGGLNVSPSSGPGGAPVSLSASGFNDDYNTGFYLTGAYGTGLIGVCPPENRANCTLVLAQLPAYGPPGTVTIEARNSIAQSGQGTFQIAPPSLSIAPRCGPPGTPITVTGRFYALGPAAGVYFAGSFIPSSSTNVPTGTTFTFTFPAPAMPNGRYPVRASNSAGNDLTQNFLLDATCDVVGEVTQLIGDGMRAFGPGRPPGGDPLALGDPVRMSDRLETPAKGGGQVTFADNTQFTLSRNAKLGVDDFTYDPQVNTGQSFFSTLQGVFGYKGGDTGANSPGIEHGWAEQAFGSIGIRGTEFSLKDDLVNETQSIFLTSGQVSITPYGTGLPQIFDAPVAITFDDTAVTSGPIVDLDTDTVADPVDNCQGVANASQCDSDGDGFGNRCDGDFNDNGATNAQDTTLFRQQLGQPSAAPSFNEADLNCNGAVNAQDTTLFRQLLGTPPGPSGLAP